MKTVAQSITWFAGLNHATRLGAKAIIVPAIILAAVFGFNYNALAQGAWNWNGSSDGNWTNAANWTQTGSGSTLPQGLVNFPSGPSRLTITNNYSAGTAGYQILFNSGASSYTIWGTSSLIMYSWATYAPKVENDSTSLQTINFPIQGQPATAYPYLQLEPASGDLTFNSTLQVNFYAGGNQLLVTSGNNHTLTLNGVVSDGGGSGHAAFALTGNSMVVLNATNTFTGATSISAGTLTIGGAGLLGGGSYSAAITNNSSFVYNSSASQTLSGVISGTGTLTESGSGTLTLSSTNTYSGATTISAGTLKIGGAGLLGGGSYSAVITNTGGFIYNSSAAQALSGVISGSGNLIHTGITNGALTLSGANTYTGYTIAGNNSSSLGLPNGVGALILNNTISSTDVRIGEFSTNTLIGSYHAALQLGANNVLPNTANLTFDGKFSANYSYLKLWGHTLTVGSITQIDTTSGGNAGNTSAIIENDQGDLGSGASALTVSNSTANYTNTYGGRIRNNGGGSGTVALVKDGSAKLVLNGPLSFSGGITVKNGTFEINGTNTQTYSGGVALQGGQLNISSSTALGAATSALTISGGTMIDNSSGSAVTMANANPENWNGDFTFVGSSSLNVGTGAVAMNASHQVTVSANTLTVGGIISGSGYGLTKAGSGTLTLANANSYSGNTIVTAGTLALTGGGSIAGSPNITVGAGGTLDVSTLTTALTLASGQNVKTTGAGASPGTINTATSKGLTLATSGTASQLYLNAYDGSNPPLTITGPASNTGSLVLATGNTVNVTNNGSALSVGSYKLISKGSGSSGVTGSAPGTINVYNTGGGGSTSGMASGTTATLRITSGELWLDVTAGVVLTITSAPTASAINYGQTLASSTLSGGSATNSTAGTNVPGTFTFTTPSVAPNAGSTNVSVTFTANDTNYFTATTNVTVSVSMTTPVLTAPVANQILVGRALASSMLIGGTATNSFNSAKVPGTFAFTTPSIVLNAGTTNVNVTFTPTDMTNYNSATTTVTVVVLGRTNWIEVYGSSVAQGYNGGGSFTNGSYANGYAGLLTAYLGANGWFVTNNSTPGYDTANGLASFPTNVLPVTPNYIMLAFGLNNEGLVTTSDPAGTTSTFLTNLAGLISLCRSNGFYPILGSCYPNNGYTATTYAYIKSANLTINSWNVPSYNLLGALDDGIGDGNYATNYWSDATHPNTAGHQEYFYTIVPTLFNALAAGKTNSPYLASATNFVRLTFNAGVTAPITFTPTNTLHSFTVSFRVRSTNSGTIAAIHSASGYATLQITNGQIVYVSTGGSQIAASTINATNGDWHDVALSFRYAITNTWLFVDGVQAGSLSEQYAPDKFTLGGPDASGSPATPAVVDFQNWCVYRSAWNLGEAQAQMQGSRQQASMEICAALDDASFTSNSPAANRAQSLSVAMVNTASLSAIQSVLPPSNLAAQSLSGTSAKLTWIANSATSLVVERRVTGSTAWSYVATVAAGTTTYTDSSLTSGTSYDYRVAALEGGLQDNYSNTATVTPGVGVHQTILIDFGPNDGSNGVVTASPDYLGQYWNNFVGAGNGVNLPAIGLANLVTTTNGSTSIGLNSISNSSSIWAANGILNGGLLSPSYALLSNFAVATATEDYFLTTTTASLAITNLDPALNYRLRLFGTRNIASTRVTQYVVTGGNGSFTNNLQTSGTNSSTGLPIGSDGVYTGNNSNIISVAGIIPNGTQQIQVGVAALTGGFGYLGIIEITANHAPVAQAISLSATLGQTLSIDVIDGTNAPTDADGDGLVVMSVSGALVGGGTATTNGGTGFTYTASATGTNQFSYTVSDPYGGTGTNTVTVVVVKATPIMQTAPAANAITYGQSLSSSIVTGALFTNVAGATVTMASTNFVLPGVVPNAGTTNVQMYFVPTDAADYNNVTNTVNVTVNPAPLGITANNTNKVYDGVAFAGGNGVTYYGFVNGDTSVSLGGTLNYGGSSQNATHTGGYTIIPSGQNSANYAISFTNGTLTISQAATFVGASSTKNPSGYKDTVAYIATLPADATGSVVFSSTNGAFSTNTVSGVTTTSLSITNLPRGTNVITVAYLGDGNYIGSTNSLNQVVTNHPPIAAVMTVTRTAGLALIISLSDIATNWNDVDGDTIELTSVTMQSTNGINLFPLNWSTNLDGSIVTTNGYAYIGYTNSPNVNDQISYGISDGFGGTNIGYVNIVIQGSVTGTNSITAYNFTSPSSNTVTAYGIPYFSYILERSTNLSSPVWVDVQTNQAAPNGVINMVDLFMDLGGVKPSPAFYQLKWQP